MFAGKRDKIANTPQDDRGKHLNIDGCRGVLDLPPKLAKKIDKPREFPDSHDGGAQILGLLRLAHDAPGVGFEFPDLPEEVVAVGGLGLPAPTRRRAFFDGALRKCGMDFSTLRASG